MGKPVNKDKLALVKAKYIETGNISQAAEAGQIDRKTASIYRTRFGWDTELIDAVTREAIVQSTVVKLREIARLNRLLGSAGTNIESVNGADLGDRGSSGTLFAYLGLIKAFVGLVKSLPGPARAEQMTKQGETVDAEFTVEDTPDPSELMQQIEEARNAPVSARADSTEE